MVDNRGFDASRRIRQRVRPYVEVLPPAVQAGRSLRQLSRSLGMDRDQLRQIVADAEAAYGPAVPR